MLKYRSAYINNDLIPNKLTLQIEVVDRYSEMDGLKTLNPRNLEKLVKSVKDQDIDGVVFIGGEKDPNDMFVLAYDFKMRHHEMLVGWWTDYTKLAEIYMSDLFDYIKVNSSRRVNGINVYQQIAGHMYNVNAEFNLESGEDDDPENGE